MSTVSFKSSKPRTKGLKPSRKTRLANLEVYAGPTARQQILEHGFAADQFKVLVGASGGPKWFVLYGLDRYLFGDYFTDLSKPVVTLGSSAGAWRLACLATADPLAAIERLGILYSRQQYSDEPTIEEVTDKARSIVEGMIGDTGANEIVHNPLFQTHIIADRGRGLLSSRNKVILGASLATSAIANVVSRRSLSMFYQRMVFSSMGHSTPYSSLNDIYTRVVPLREDNVVSAILASGSIPFVLTGERDIPGAGKGLYMDGGITDYHFDLPFHQATGLVLYPHFSSRVIPGWFDKQLPWRKITSANYHNVVMLAPSPKFVDSLPGKKIPDRKDFSRYSPDQRIKIWQQVMQRSQLLADEFAMLVDTGITVEEIQSL